MRLLFIDPPFYRFMGYYTRYFPYGLASLATSARQLGHASWVYDADHDPSAANVDYQRLYQAYPSYLSAVQRQNHPIWVELKETIDRLKPDWIGITALTAKTASVLQTATVIRAYAPDIPIIVGGPHAVVRSGELLENAPELDAVFIGEGEECLNSLTSLTRPDFDRPSVDIPGVVTRLSPERYSEACPVDVAAVPAPSRDVLLHTDYSKEDLGLVMTARGCPFSCTYCFSRGLWRRRVRMRSVDAIGEEMEYLRTSYAVRHITFKDDVFTMSSERTVAICNILKELNLSWDCVTRVDTFDPELLSIMKESGCTGIKIGVETGSERLMKTIDRRLDKDTIRQAASWLRKSGIYWTAYFMMGLPGESLEETEETYRFMKEIAPDFASLSGYEAFPGTALFNAALKEGVVVENMSRHDFFTINPHDYYFRSEDRGMKLPQSVTFRDLETKMQYLFHMYNRSPSRLGKRLKERYMLWRNEPGLMRRDISRFRRWILPKR